MLTKVCSKCGQEKTIDSFYRKKGGKYGVREDCKSCKKEYNKRYRQENKEYFREYYRKYRQENKEYYREYKKKYWQENKEYCREYNKRYYDENKEYFREYYQENKEYYREYRQENREYSREYKRERYKNNPQDKLSRLIRVRTRKLVQSGKAKKFCGYNEYIGCTPEEAVRHIESQFHRHPSTGKDMNWDNHGEWHIDHIRPLASFDLTREEDFMQAHHYTNLQPLWAEENLSKGANWDEE